jgi:dCMP deaminase
MSRIKRPEPDEYFLRMALLVATRSTCPRRSVGCVLVDKHNHILATGYNGVPKGVVHCLDVPCRGADQKSGEGLDLCEATHAEQNALLQCSDTQAIERVYTTTSPCIHCVKLILNTGAKEIVFLESYTDSRPEDIWNKVHFEDIPATWRRYEIKN